jgi:hypothetical protein
MTGLYVYAIAAGPVRLRTRGIFGRPLRDVTVGRLHALIEPASRAPKPSLARLKAQGRILNAIVQTGGDVLPTRFGTFVSDKRELERALEGRSAALRRALRQVRGCVQMTVRVTPAEGGPVAQASTLTRKYTDGIGGAAYLKRLAARDRSRRVDPSIRAFTAAAEPLVRATRVEWRNSTAMLFHLVPRTKLTRYVAAMSDAAGRVDAEAVLSGPSAAFAFAAAEAR